jgi:hypothetical protein
MVGMERANDFLVRDMPLTSSLTPTGHTDRTCPARDRFTPVVSPGPRSSDYPRAKFT